MAREDIRLQKAISDDAADWRRYDQGVDRLYRGMQLDEALTWAQRNLPSLDELAFLQTSVAERERQQEEARRKRYTRRIVLAVGITGAVGLEWPR